MPSWSGDFRSWMGLQCGLRNGCLTLLRTGRDGLRCSSSLTRGVTMVSFRLIWPQSDGGGCLAGDALRDGEDGL